MKGKMWSVSLITISASCEKQEAGQLSHEEHKQQKNTVRRLETWLEFCAEMISPNQFCASVWVQLDAAAVLARWSALMKWLVLILLSAKWYFMSLIHCAVCVSTSSERSQDIWLATVWWSRNDDHSKPCSCEAPHQLFKDVLKVTHPRRSLYISAATCVSSQEAACL